jgi:molybdenum-dependent DNA-binding transcriptional regulator ModE
MTAKIENDLVIKDGDGYIVLDLVRSRLLLGIRTIGSLRGAIKYVGASRPHAQKWVKQIDQMFDKRVFRQVGRVNGTTRIELTEFGDWLLDTYVDAYNAAKNASDAMLSQIKSHVKEGKNAVDSRKPIESDDEG